MKDLPNGAALTMASVEELEAAYRDSICALADEADPAAPSDTANTAARLAVATGRGLADIMRDVVSYAKRRSVLPHLSSTDPATAHAAETILLSTYDPRIDHQMAIYHRCRRIFRAQFASAASDAEAARARQSAADAQAELDQLRSRRIDPKWFAMSEA